MCVPWKPLRSKIQEMVDTEAGDGQPGSFLFFQSKRLQNDLTLEMYRIKDSSNLELHLPCTNDQHVCIGKEIGAKS